MERENGVLRAEIARLQLRLDFWIREAHRHARAPAGELPELEDGDLGMPVRRERELRIARLRAAGLACGEIGWLLGLPESEVRAVLEAARVDPDWLRRQEEREE